MTSTHPPIEPRLPEPVLALHRLEAAPGDLLLIHYSAYAPRLEPLLDLPNRKLLVYHNVTPARYLWSFQPHVAALCEIGRDHLPRYAQAADVAVAVSEYNAGELRAAGAHDVRVVPILFDPDRFGHTEARPDVDRPLVVSVGRLAPHKRHDLVIRAFALYQRELRAGGASRMRRRADQRRLPRPAQRAWPRHSARATSSCRGRSTRTTSRTLYGEASAALYLSEHEGFCIPLIEAFHFEIPVVARPSGRHARGGRRRRAVDRRRAGPRRGRRAARARDERSRAAREPGGCGRGPARGVRARADRGEAARRGGGRGG